MRLNEKIKTVVNSLQGWDDVVNGQTSKILQKCKTTAEAIVEADLDWEAIKRPISIETKKGNFSDCPDRFALTRQDRLFHSPPIFGIVKKKYVPLQNKEAFSFFDGILSLKAATIAAAGSFDEGRIVYILAKLPGTIKVIDKDISEKYLLLSNTHDGKQSVTIKFIPVRIVCTNQLTSTSLDGSTLRVIHSRGVQDRLTSAKNLLGLINTQFDTIESNFKKMIKIKMSSKDVDLYMQKIYNPNAKRSDKNLISATKPSFNNKGLESSKELWVAGKGNDIKGVSGTLWAAYNGVTEYIDHHTKQRTGEAMLKSIWTGAGDLIKRRAYNEAVKLLK